MEAILAAAARSPSSIAVRTIGGAAASTYGQLLEGSKALQARLAGLLPPRPAGGDGPRVGIYAAPGAAYVAATWATWMAGGIAVPLAVSHPPHELGYVLQDAGVSAVLAPPSALDKLSGVCHAAGAALEAVPDELVCGPPVDAAAAAARDAAPPAGSSSSSSASSSSSSSRDGDGAVIIYTSGTTGRPKGALHTHGSLAAQVRALVSAWRWVPRDTIVHALPLHHVHGMVNALYCPHAVGAAVTFLPRFSPALVWSQLMAGDVSVLMAVPTMYSHLLSHYESQLSAEEQAAARRAAGALRLAVSGSAAAPLPLLQRWQQLSGRPLLERYGMTETGMILSNPYQGERRPGFVGVPLPGVEVKVVPAAPGDCSNSSSASSSDGAASSGGALQQGELAVRGPALFREYWGRPDATAAAFDAEGYFLTGDTVSLEGQPPYFKIMGRTSVDILKSGGFKLSALDIESALLRAGGVAEVAVLGVPDKALGQAVAALVVSQGAGQDGQGTGADHEALLGRLRAAADAGLPAYAHPRVWRLLDAPLPRNAMGKVNKKQLLRAFFPAEADGAAGT